MEGVNTRCLGLSPVQRVFFFGYWIPAPKFRRHISVDVRGQTRYHAGRAGEVKRFALTGCAGLLFREVSHGERS